MFCSALYGDVRLCCRTTPRKYPGNRRATAQLAGNRCAGVQPVGNCRARDCRAYTSASNTRAGELVQRSAR